MIIFPVWEFLRLYTAAKTSEISTAKQKTIEQRDNQRSKKRQQIRIYISNGKEYCIGDFGSIAYRTLE
jgi:hypothetical protein